MSLNPGLGYLAITNVLRTLETFCLENFQNTFGSKPALVVFFLFDSILCKTEQTLRGITL